MDEIFQMDEQIKSKNVGKFELVSSMCLKFGNLEKRKEKGGPYWTPFDLLIMSLL